MFSRIFSRYPALPMAAGMPAGIIAVHYSLFVVVCTCIAAACLLLARLKVRPRHIAILASSAIAGGVLTYFMKPPELPAEYFDSEERTYTGIVQNVRTGERSQRCYLDVGGDTAFRIAVFIADVVPTITPGDIMSVTGVLEVADKYADVPTLDFGRDYSGRTSARMAVNADDCRVTGHDTSLMTRLQDFRGTIADAIYASTLAPATSRLLVSATLGNENPGPAVRERFRATGLSHLLCVSGFHTALLAAVAALLLFPLRLWSRAGRYRHLIVIAIVWLYALLTGFMPSVVRAAVMISIYLGAKISERDAYPLNSLCIAVFIILAINPYWLFSIGFQLSVAAVLGLIAFANKLNPVPRRLGLAHKAASLVAVPLAALAGTAPIVLMHFHTLPLLSIPANAVAALIFPLFMAGGAAVAFLSALGLPMGFAASCIDNLADAITGLCDYLAAIPGAFTSGIYLSTPNLLIFTAAIICLAAMLHLGSLRHKVCFATLAVILGCCTGCSNSERNTKTDFMVNAHGRDADLVIRNGAKGTTMTLTSRPAADYAAYFGRAGISVENVTYRVPPKYLTLGRKTILIPNGDRMLPHRLVDVIILTRQYRGRLDDALDRTSARTVLVLPEISPDKRKEYLDICSRRGVETPDLRLHPYIDNF